MFQEPQPQSPQQPAQSPAALFDVVPAELPYVDNAKRVASDMLFNEEAIQQASFNAALQSFKETGKNSPEFVAFRRNQRMAGLPEPSDAAQMQQYAEMQRFNFANMQKESPVLFERMKDYENAELLRQDSEAWSMSERIAGSTKRGDLEMQQGKLSFKRNYSSLNEEEEAEYQRLTKELSILPSPNGNWIAAAGKMLGQMYSMGPENAAWAGLGALVGSAGGPGGTAAGFYWGLTAGNVKQTFVTEAGSATQGMIDQGYDPKAAKITGLFHGAVASAITGISFGAATSSLRSAVKGMVGPSVLSKIGIDPAKRMLFGNFTGSAAFGRYAAGVVAEDVEEIGQELSLIMAERIAGSISREEYQQAIQTAQGTESLGQRILDIAVETFQGTALLGLPALSMDLHANKARLAQAESRAKALTQTIDLVRGTTASKLAPDAYADQVAEIAENQGSDEVVMSRTQLNEAIAAVEDRMRKQNPGLSAGEAMHAFRSRFPEIAKQMDASEKDGSDLRLKVTDVALMARGEFGLHEEILRRGRIVGEGMDGDAGISWEEAVKQRAVAEQLRTQAMSIQARRGKKHMDEHETVRRDIERKLSVVPQFSKTQVKFVAQMTADYYAVRAERMSQEGTPMSVLQAYKQDEFTLKYGEETKPKFVDTPTKVEVSPEPTVSDKPAEQAPAAEEAAAPAEAPKEEAAPTELLAPESLKFQQAAQRQSVVKQLSEQDDAVQDTELSSAAARRIDAASSRKEELTRLDAETKAEAERVRGLDRQAYIQELESDLDKAKTLLEGMDEKSDDYKKLMAWAKYAHSYLLQEQSKAAAQASKTASESEKLFSFAGVKARTANITSLEEAKTRIAANDDKESVRKDTGWFQGADGKWRFEIDDSQSSWNPQFEKILSIIDEESGPFSSPQVMLAGVLDAWDLLSKNQWNSSKVYKTGDYQFGISYKNGDQLTDSQLRTIVKNYGSYVTKGFRKPGSVKLGDLLQHDKLFAAYPLLADIQVEYSQKEAKSGSMASMEGFYKLRIGNIRKNVVGKSGLDERYSDPFVKMLRKVVLHESQHAIQLLEMFAFGSSAIDASYFKSAGEAEARNVERRLDMSEQERQDKSAESTEDVARNEQIIVINGKPFQSIKLQQPDVFRSRATATPPDGYVKGIRYSVGEKGLMNNQVLDRSKLSDDQEFELAELMDFGLEQPRDVDAGDSFYFTESGNVKHKRLISLLKKAAIGKVTKTEVWVKPKWTDTRGDQVSATETLPISKTQPIKAQQPDVLRSRATAQDDAAYLSAVERGDMETAQRMVDEAAKAAGYNYFGYHASSENFTEFLSRAEQAEAREEEFDYDGYEGGNLGIGFYFTPELSYAKRFGTPRKFFLKIDNIIDQRDPAVVDRLKEIYGELVEDRGGATEGEAYDALIEETGSNGIIADDVGGFAYGATELLVKQSSQAKLADPVTYDESGKVIPLSQRFQSESPDIRYSRDAGIAGMVDLATMEITLTKDATFSTFIHEMSHIWLNVLMRDAQSANAPKQIVDDAKALLTWFGIKDFAAWNSLSSSDKAVSHEKWAYNFEGYISGESAPSRELTPIFRSFRRWLTKAWTNIRSRLNLAYRQELEALGKPVEDLPILTTEVAEVMNRMLATDEQIALNQDFQSLMALHMTKDQWLALGNTESEWMELLRLQTAVASDITDELTEQTIRGMEWLSSKNIRMLQEHRAKVDEQRKKIEKELLPNLRQTRVHVARNLIKTGELLNPDGTVKLQMSEARLNLELVRNLFSKDAAMLARVESELGTGKSGMLYSKGVDPSQLASVLGYPDAKSMIIEMLNAPSLEEDLSTMVDKEMKAKYKDMLDPKKIQKIISASLSGKMRQKMVAIELRGLDRNLRKESDAAQPNVVAEMAEADTELQTFLKSEKRMREERDALKASEVEIQKQITKEKRKGATVRDEAKISALKSELDAKKSANAGKIASLNSSLKDLNKRIRKAERLAEGPRTSIATILSAAKEVAIELMGKTLVKDALPSIYEANARMRRRGTTVAMAKGESLVAIEQKRGELTQAALAEQASEFQQEMDRFKDFVQAMFKMNKADIAKSRDYNMAIAARGVAAAFGFGTENQAEAITDAIMAMRVYAPEVAAQVEILIAEANQQASKISGQAQARGLAASRSKRNRVGPLYRELTVEQMQQLMDRVTGLWKRSAEERQVNLGGVKRSVEEAAGMLAAKVIQRMGGKPINASKTASGIMSYIALATRAEHLMEHLDGQQVGDWQVMVYRSVKDAAVKARGEFAQKLKKLTSILAEIDMRHGETVVADELGGHVFGEDPTNPLISELMHFVLHMGNPENLEKIAVGMTRKNNPTETWGKFDEEGNLDTSDITKFINRMIDQKILTKQHFQAAEQIFELMDELTPGALKAYYAVNGTNMKLVKHGKIINSLGEFRGGYVPSQVDKDAVPLGDIMDLRAQMNEQFSNGMPKARDGMTKERRKNVKLPRVINLNSLPSHIRDVLFYTHLQPVVHDLGKVFTNETLQGTLKSYDPAIMTNVLIPWMGRSVRQLTQLPTNNPLDKIVRKIRRNVGLDKLALNFNVMLQQFTGLSVSSTRVPKRQLGKALAIWMKSPLEARKYIASMSTAMAERFDNQMTEMMNKLEEVIKSPNAYKNFRIWAMENGMVLQAGAQNIVDSITWIGAFNEFMENKSNGLSTEEAQKQAAAEADSIVRITQGGSFAEDLSTSEAGTVWAQLFSQFQTVFIVMMNAAGWKARTIIQDMGMLKASPRVISLAFFGLYLPLAVGNMISESMRGEFGDDEDMDGTSETWFRTLVMAPIAGMASGLPQVGYLINFGLNSLDNKRYNDKMGSTPVFGAFEAARRGIGGAYELITDPSRNLRGQDIKDWATLIATATGIPASVVAKPASYYLDEGRGFYNPSNMGGYVRGMVTGTGIPANR